MNTVCLVTCFISDGCVSAKQKVDKRILPLAELRDLASAESVDSFTEAYLKLLENHPDCPVRKSCSYPLRYSKHDNVFHRYFLSSLPVSSSLGVHLSLQPEVVEKLVALRDDIPKKDAKEVLCLHYKPRIVCFNAIVFYRDRKRISGD